MIPMRLRRALFPGMNVPHPDLLRETEAYLQSQIPLTKQMGVRIASFEGDDLVLTAPLEPNHNHLGTAFGGSLAALATLAGYVMVWLLLEDRSAHVVVRESHIRYRRPVRGCLRAVCARPAKAEWQVFQGTFAASGKAHLRMRVRIEEGGEVGVEFEGDFVALK
jgi:thioesterase domain-containing protein